MRLPYDELWNDSVALVRANRPLLIALAGAFFFLPNLALALLAPFEQPAPGVSLVEALSAYMRENWPLVLAGGLVEMLGTLTMLNLFLRPEGRTVGALIAGSLMLLPGLFVAGFFANLILMLGFALLVVPGIYALGRLALLAPAVAAERRRNPFEALGRSFELTKGHGFAVAGILVLVYVLGFLISLAATRGLGSVAILLAGRDAGMLVSEVLGALVWAAVNVLLVALGAVLYRRLAGRERGAASA
ncbi:MAG: hypothetical protein QOC65_1239 [Sphingomonadales bacterium]|nr:hypothetical protein [Sphingomonadales bacterium]